MKVPTETQPGTSGLALTAVQNLPGNEFYPQHFFTDGAQGTTEVVTHLISSLTVGGSVPRITGSEADVHVFDIIARIVRDDILRVDNGPVPRIVFKQQWLNMHRGSVLMLPGGLSM